MINLFRRIFHRTPPASVPARDRLHLPNVTLYMYDCAHPQTGLAVLKHCSRLVQFGACVMVTNADLPAPGHIQMIKTTGKTLIDYNKHIVLEMTRNVSTDFALVVQTDGFILNPEKWKPEFLQFDYIGAPWGSGLQQDYPFGTRVGNGGFSLRSKKLMDLTSTFTEYDPDRLSGFDWAEDFYVCKVRYQELLRHNIKIADLATAADFSLEADIPEHPRTYADVFGFHGRFKRTQKFIKGIKNLP